MPEDAVIPPEPAPESRPLHRTLSRQLRRLGAGPGAVPSPAAWAAILAAVSQAYEESDADRYTLERSIEVSSTEMRGLHDVLRRRALHDELTGLPNRAALMERLTALIAAAHQGEPAPALLFVDLDGFKLVNDTLGHEAGDDLLVRAAKRITALLGTADLVARLGGDEFVIVVQQSSDAQRLAARVTRELARPFRILGRDALVSASVGVAFATGEETSPDDVLGRADLAMYAAKLAGRSRFVVFTEAMQAAADQRMSVKSALRAAIGQDELFLEYQPLVRLRDLFVLGAEALVRWRRPQIGIVQPIDFIPIAEEAHTIGAVDEWVLGQALTRATKWCARGGQISINLSSQSLSSADLLATVRAALRAATVSPAQLTLELTETALIVQDPLVTSNLLQLRELGVRLAIDDFGTGYSSLHRLRSIAVHSLKLDRSLIEGIDEDPGVAAIAAAAITMGHALGNEVIAEGVERFSQVELLRAMGCDAAQGYLFGRPGEPDWIDGIISRPIGQLAARQR